MRYLFIFALISFSASGQALRDINYSFLYNPNEPIEFDIKVIRSTQGWTAFYRLSPRDTTSENLYVIQWELRKDLSEKEGTPVSPEQISKTTKANHETEGSITMPNVPERQYLTAKVLNNTVKRVWIYHKVLDPKYPVNGYLSSDGVPVIETFVKVNTPMTLGGEGEQKIVSYYNDNFPAAVPGFSEGMGRVARSMVVDSTFTRRVGDQLSFNQTGLYLIQSDTTSAEGLAFRVEEDYPRLSKVESLADPLIYICTKQEFARIKQAKGDKKAFDRIILSITQNTERARTFMRSYFRRVELANQFFTSYKEGWKTDRGMIYIIFGLPDEVFRFSDREVWSYKNNLYKVNFDFIRSSTLFDPENYVLIRDKKFQETWYEVIDLWRNARF
ncbi:GWxTD domain-containing protein [Chryseolinea sp. H1M3-3]|uniref:GWxTD domain-containing protein n=1 Tax=Chryseolinea sp. H1M3-3 TaxID=3034144 RepID=UPI0023ECE4C5|nr:GWxTD domain-containing protein [Chryseolinea sp. H1M3-3]